MTARGNPWLEAEDAILLPFLRQAVNWGAYPQIMALLPGRGKQGIRERLRQLRKRHGIVLEHGPAPAVVEQDELDPQSVRAAEMVERVCCNCRRRVAMMRFVFRCHACLANAGTMNGVTDPVFYGRVR